MDPRTQEIKDLVKAALDKYSEYEGESGYFKKNKHFHRDSIKDAAEVAEAAVINLARYEEEEAKVESNEEKQN